MFKVGDLVQTCDGGIGRNELGTRHANRRSDGSVEEAYALVTCTPESKRQPKYAYTTGEFEVCYCSGPCRGDIAREATHNFRLVSSGR
jgi:hypothetical protein